MSRFANLEFDGNLEPREEAQAVVKDEAYYLNEARAAFARGQFEPGLRWYSKVLEYNPNNAEAWAGQVRMLIELGEFREAKVWADKALEKLPNAPELLAAKAVALGRLGDLKAALAFSDASMEEQGEAPYTWLARGDVMLARKEKFADYCFEKALMLAGTNWFYAWLASRIYAFYEKVALALKHAQQAITWDAGQSVAWLQAGHCQFALGLASGARASFTQARQLDPQCLAAHKALAELDRQGAGAWFSNWWRRHFRL